MRFHLLTIFPDFFSSPLKIGLMKRAIEKGLIEVYIHNLRDFALDKHKVVDDEPYGGGEGMVFKPEPLYRAITSIKSVDPEVKIIYLSPSGRLLNQRVAEELSREKSLLLICGRYEGIDERIREMLVEDEISIGDYIVFGGEVAALVLLEVLTRLVPEVIGRRESVLKESFSSGLLKYPCYTRPAEFRGRKVPEVLLSGNHQAIEKYRRSLSLRLTLRKRPQLLKEAPLSQEDLMIIKEYLEKQRLYIFLIHYPVYNKKGEVIASAISNIDFHDLARLGRTYGVKGVYVIQPLDDQRALGQELLNYWLSERGLKYNPLRSSALKLVQLFSNLDEALLKVREIEGDEPILIATDASPKREYISIERVRELLWEKPICLLFGTAWGLEESIIRQCQFFLEPLWGRLDTYNHLSVRSACAIYLDRIFEPYLLFRKK